MTATDADTSTHSIPHARALARPDRPTLQAVSRGVSRRLMRAPRGSSGSSASSSTRPCGRGCRTTKPPKHIGCSERSAEEFAERAPKSLRSVRRR
eukprot:1830624-Pleurochrysis_carterae.AAC.1